MNSRLAGFTKLVGPINAIPHVIITHTFAVLFNLIFFVRKYIDDIYSFTYINTIGSKALD